MKLYFLRDDINLKISFFFLKIFRSLLEEGGEGDLEYLNKLDFDLLSFLAVMVFGSASCAQSCFQFTATVWVAWPSNPSIKKLGQVCLCACGCMSSSIDVDVPP